MLLSGIERFRVLGHLFTPTSRCGLLSRAAIFFRYRHPDRTRKSAYRLRKTRARMLHQERDGTAMGSTTETVIKLFGGTNGE